ncbi:response regulator [Patescibacteria group bacterium]|nr:response regulator [Patescibacteria group bacterium]MBU1246452.1 response regulator [Patescibacteria group bacterium]MBU1519399.1 response regulator [Patescibacteria group bacterium]MBU1730159.1 response regulator [Patescibacteria group bacterium]MBU1956700.1 response regulator [Patescibacteria group bacterium]
MIEKKRTILIVEDEGLLRELMSEKLQIEGFNTIEAVDGDEGLTLALQKRPDLIVLDLLMPKMGGMEVLRRLREDDYGRSIPVIIVSNLSGKENIAEGAEKGAIEYLIKANFSLEEIVNKIKEMGRLRMQW